MNKLEWILVGPNYQANGHGFLYRVSKDFAPSGEWRAFVLEPKGIEFNAACATPDFGKKFCEFFHEHISNLVQEAYDEGSSDCHREGT